MGNGIEQSLGWRYVFYISGLLGIVLAPIILFTVKEPERNRNATISVSTETPLVR